MIFKARTTVTLSRHNLETVYHRFKEQATAVEEVRQLLEKDHFAFVFPLPAWGLVFDVADFK